MTLTKIMFIRTLAESFCKKLGSPYVDPSQLNLISQMLTPAVNQYDSIMRTKGILDSGNNIHYRPLEDSLKNVFEVTPIINIPIQGTSFSITREDILQFLRDIKARCKDDVICLPYQP